MSGTANSPVHPELPHPSAPVAWPDCPPYPTAFLFQLIDQIDRVEEAHPLAAVDGSNSQGGGQMGFAGSCAANQNEVMCGFHEIGARQLLDLRLLQRGFRIIKACQISMYRNLAALSW